MRAGAVSNAPYFSPTLPPRPLAPPQNTALLPHRTKVDVHGHASLYSPRPNHHRAYTSSHEQEQADVMYVGPTLHVRKGRSCMTSLPIGSSRLFGPLTAASRSPQHAARLPTVISPVRSTRTPPWDRGNLGSRVRRITGRRHRCP